MKLKEKRGSMEWREKIEKKTKTQNDKTEGVLKKKANW